MIKNSKDLSMFTMGDASPDSSNILLDRELYLKFLKKHEEMEISLQESADFLKSQLPQEDALLDLEKKYNITLDAYYLPSSILGGDFYRFLEVDANRMGFYLWDSSGHGITAAINSLRLNSAIKDCAIKDPGEFVTCVNSTLCVINKKGVFATIFYGILDKQNRILEYASAACPYPVLLSVARNEYMLIDTKEFPLGAVTDHQYQTHSINLEKWDTALLYSDALIETRSNLNGAFLKIEDLAVILLEYLKNKKSASSSDIKQKVLSMFNPEYSQNLQDDLTLQIIRF